MKEHPTREQLRDLVWDRLPAHAARAVVTHLLLGCERCQAAMAPLALPLFAPGRTAVRLGAPREDAYEAPVESAYASALGCARRLERERSEAPAGLARLGEGLDAGADPQNLAGRVEWTFGLCELTLEASLALRFADPDRMIALAELARQGVARLAPGRYPEDRVADLAARATAELANAYRVKGELRRAEATMADAWRRARCGTGSPELKARLAELSSNLFGDQRRFEAAQQMLDVAYAVHRRAGRVHETGLVLIRKGLLVGLAGDPARGILFLGSGLAAVDRQRDPRLVFHTLHNILAYKIELGDYRQAAAQLWQMRPLYRRYGSQVEGLKLRWFEAKIAAGLGDLSRAERAYLETRRGFEQAGLALDAAVVALELAGHWQQAGRTEQVRGLVEELVAVFADQGVHREALAALGMLHDAVRRQGLTAELIAAARGVLEHVEHR